MRLLFSREGISQTASGILAVVLAMRRRFLLGGGLSQSHSPQTLRTAEGLILQLQRFFDRHPLPAEDAIVCYAMPSFYFHIADLIHTFAP